MYLIGFPLLIIPFAVYNIIAFLFGVGFSDTVFTVRLFSGADWAISTSDILLVVALLLLFLEVIKATRLGSRSIMDHLLSLVLFLAMLAEFVMVRAAATSTFFLLVTISFVDVIAGFSVTIRTAERDIGIDTTETLRQ
ncbi:MAG: hypothetical protein M3R18_08145 [Pseudomonadota bacterium]|nr:hypothetical protein [Pseudomonadota bacterium]